MKVETLYHPTLIPGVENRKKNVYIYIYAHVLIMKKFHETTNASKLATKYKLMNFMNGSFAMKQLNKKKTVRERQKRSWRFFAE